tara:strand:- start:2404 stop:3465 length:1062 start_codon:yes stop_codon:yes gene_type:complete
MPVQNFEILNTNTDVTTTRTLLHEVIPLTGTIISGTYGTYPSERNIKNFAHGMFQSVYDYPYLSSSANHIFDITMGYDESSALSGTTSGHLQNSKKINIYNQFAQVLLGYTGSNHDVEIFESDLSFGDNDNQMKECYFIALSRLVTKDQIKKGSFSITLGTGSYATPFSKKKTLTDVSASETAGTNNKGNSGEYGVLYDSPANANGLGVIFYQAGVVVLTASLFQNTDADFGTDLLRSKHGINQIMTGTAISGNCDSLRRRIQNLSYNNTTEINSTIYFCRVPHGKYNYSSNPTYTTGSKIRVKTVASDTPVAYITTIGLYNAKNELMATAKLSEPLRKDPTNEITLRVRLDY